MARILFELSTNPDEESTGNLCKAFEIEFTEPVNAFWLLDVIEKALDKAYYEKMKADS